MESLHSSPSKASPKGSIAESLMAFHLLMWQNTAEEDHKIPEKKYHNSFERSRRGTNRSKYTYGNKS